MPKPRSYDEHRALQEYALRVFLDPESDPEDRKDAQERLTGKGTRDFHRLTTDEMTVNLWIEQKAHDGKLLDWGDGHLWRPAAIVSDLLGMLKVSYLDHVAARKTTTPDYTFDAATTEEDCPACAYTSNEYGDQPARRATELLLSHHMKHAQRVWDRLVKLCADEGAAAPPPIYSFTPTTFAAPLQAQPAQALGLTPSSPLGPLGVETDEPLDDWDEPTRERIAAIRVQRFIDNA